MILYRLENAPSQRFTTYLNGYKFDIRLITIATQTYADVFINSEPICFSAICAPNRVVMPYTNNTIGNFYFYCPDLDYPYYEKFGKNQQLYFLSPEELDALPTNG